MQVLLEQNPHWYPFDFSAVAANATAEARRKVVESDVWVTAISTFNSVGAGSTQLGYRLLLFDYLNNFRLMDEEISRLTFESDCQTLFRLPTPLFIPHETEIVARVRNTQAGANGQVQVCLHATPIKPGQQPDLKKQPFFYSYYFTLSFPADIFAAAKNTFDFHPSQPVGKAPLDWDFELTGITVDSTSVNGANVVPASYFIQLVDAKRNTLYESPVVLNSAAGSMTNLAFTSTGHTLPTDYPNKNVMQHRLQRPRIFKRGTTISVRLYVRQTLFSSVSGGYIDNVVNVVLIGNRVYE